MGAPHEYPMNTPKQGVLWEQRIHKISMSIFSNVFEYSPPFVSYTSGVPDKVCDFVWCPYTLHSKNRTKMRFFLHISQIFCIFVPDSYAGGKYVLRKAFRNGAFIG